MIQNRLITAEGNMLRFHVNHTVNGEVYKLSENERYYFSVAPEDDPGNILFTNLRVDGDFEFRIDIEAGMYVFELSLYDGKTRQVIIPALDERNRPLNQLIVLRRLYN